MQSCYTLTQSDMSCRLSPWRVKGLLVIGFRGRQVAQSVFNRLQQPFAKLELLEKKNPHDWPEGFGGSFVGHLFWERDMARLSFEVNGFSQTKIDFKTAKMSQLLNHDNLTTGQISLTKSLAKMNHVDDQPPNVPRPKINLWGPGEGFLVSTRGRLVRSYIGHIEPEHAHLVRVLDPGWSWKQPNSHVPAMLAATKSLQNQFRIVPWMYIYIQ